MNLTVEKKPAISAELDMKKFKDEIVNSFDLEKAIKDNITFSKLPEDVEEYKAKEMAYLNINWGRVIALYKDSSKTVMEIHMFLTNVKGLEKYTPKHYDTKSGEFTFEKTIIEEPRVLTTHSFIPLIEHHVETMLADAVFEYGDKSWVPIIYIE